jgi:hypothetical protein
MKEVAQQTLNLVTQSIFNYLRCKSVSRKLDRSLTHIQKRKKDTSLFYGRMYNE